MSATRREFLRTAGPVVLAPSVRRWGFDRRVPVRLRILILGGTGFIGPHQVRAALAHGHEVTLFNRGVTALGLFPQLETIIGDRHGKLDGLAGRKWDVVIDNSATLPRLVRASTSLLRDAVKLYLFVSSTGVYFPYRTPPLDESSPVQTLDDPTTEKVDDTTFGGLKALCEEAARLAFPGRHLVLRPTYIVGPGDRSDRFTYWPVRIDRGGEVLAPGTPADPMQHVDVRDLAQFTLELLERDVTGTFNVVGSSLSNAELLYGIRAVTTAEVRFTWVDADFLAAHGVTELTMWTAPRGDFLGMMQVSAAKAFAHGFRIRPLADTARDTLAWFRTLDHARQARLRSGLTPEREVALLTAYHERRP